MNKIKIVFTVLVSCLFVFLTSVSVEAATLSILRPFQSDRISGVYEIGFSVFNTGQETVPYELRLKNSSCSDAGTAIASSNFSSSIANGFYTHIWNTASVADGTYCLQLCVQFYNGGSQCTQRVFSIINHTNNNPIITSFPTKLDYKSNEVFKYQVSAYDPDGDLINYKILSAPDFIYLDQNGFMSIGSYMVAGNYQVSIAVIDSKGGATQQTFTLKVTKYIPPTPKPTALVTKPAGVTPTPIPTVVEGEPNILITKPLSTSIFQGKANTVSWDYKDIESSNISSVLIEYSKSGSSEFQVLYDYTKGSIQTYSFDVTNLENGEYTIRISVRDLNEKLIAQRESDKFLIANRTDEANLLSIFDLKPENKSTIEDRKPEISASFSTSDDATIDKKSVVVKLDKKDITKNCSILDDGFLCSVDQDLSDGSHTIEVKLKDSSNQTLEQSWVFYVNTDEQDPNGNGGSGGIGFDLEQIKILYPWCGGLLFIVLLIFIIALLSKKKSEVNPFASKSNNFDNFKPSEPSLAYDDLSDIENQLDFGNSSKSPVVQTSPQPSASDDIPDWLKGTTDEESQPVGMDEDGGDIQDLLPQDDSVSEVHDNFGMTSSE